MALCEFEYLITNCFGRLGEILTYMLSLSLAASCLSSSLSLSHSVCVHHLDYTGNLNPVPGLAPEGLATRCLPIMSRLLAANASCRKTAPKGEKMIKNRIGKEKKKEN